MTVSAGKTLRSSPRSRSRRVEELQAQLDGPGDRVLVLALVADVERGDALVPELGRDGRDGPRDVVVFERDLLVDRLAGQLAGPASRHLLGQDVEGPGIRECPIGLGKLVPQELDRLPADMLSTSTPPAPTSATIAGFRFVNRRAHCGAPWRKGANQERCQTSSMTMRAEVSWSFSASRAAADVALLPKAGFRTGKPGRSRQGTGRRSLPGRHDRVRPRRCHQ